VHPPPCRARGTRPRVGTPGGGPRNGAASAELPAGCPHPQPLPHRTTWKRKNPGKVVGARPGQNSYLCRRLPGPAWGGTGMDSLTKGSGVAVSVLVAATASVLLLLPGHPRASSWRDVTSGAITTSSAAATSSSAIPRPGGPHPATATPAPDLRAAGSRPACRAAGAHGSRTRPGPGHRPRLRRWSGLRHGPGLRHRGGGPGLARPGSCRTPRDGPHQEAPGRLPR